jgi:hypothetical protein
MAPTISLSPNPINEGSTLIITGSGWDYAYDADHGMSLMAVNSGLEFGDTLAGYGGGESYFHSDGTFAIPVVVGPTPGGAPPAIIGLPIGAYNIQMQVAGTTVKSNIVRLIVVDPATTLTIEVDDLTTGETSHGTNKLNVNIGDQFTITGVVSPDPNLAAGDLEVEVPAIIGSTAESKVGVLAGGFYKYGPAIVGPGTASFNIQTSYIPTGSQSPIVNVTVQSAPPPPPPPPTNETVSLMINDLTTGQSSVGANAIAMNVGDSFTITGQVLPDPGLAAGDLEVQIPGIPGSTSSSKVGVLAGGFFSYGPAIVGPQTSNFTIQATYLPTGNKSPIVTVTVKENGQSSEAVSIQINDLTTGKSSVNNQIAMNEGDSFTITGQVLPDPNLAAGDLEVQIPAIPNSTGASNVGVIAGGYYSYGPATVGPNTPNFTIRTTYIPTGDQSPIITVTIGSSTTPPPVGSWWDWLLAAGAIGLILLAFLL